MTDIMGSIHSSRLHICACPDWAVKYKIDMIQSLFMLIVGQLLCINTCLKLAS